MTLIKTETLTEDKGTLTLRTVVDEAVEVSTAGLKDQDDQAARNISYCENEIRVAQARLVELQARKAKTAALLSEGLVKVPPKPVEEPLGEGVEEIIK
jgi:hypothetical protein